MGIKGLVIPESLEKVFETRNESAALHTVNLHQEIESDVSVFADAKILISIIQNIVANAIKHSEKGGTITVSAKSKDDKIIVHFKDSGVGMSKDIMSKLFTPQMKTLAAARK